MEILEDVFAGWSFELYDNVDKSEFLKLFSILDETDLLVVNRLSLSDKKVPVNSREKIFEEFIKSNSSKQDLLLEGVTMLETHGRKEKYEGVIYVLFEPNLRLISIDTYSDAWMPIGLYGDISQIDAGISNAERLRDGLKRVSQLSFIKKVIPSDNECFKDYSAYQIGFRIFYKCDIADIHGLTKEDRSKVAPFILSPNEK